MKDKTVSKWVKYCVTAVFGALLAAAVLSLRDFSWSLEPAERYRILCDAFTFPGLLLILTAALLALSNEGALLGVGYVTSIALRGLIPGMGSKQETYAEYRERKTGKGRAKGYGFLLVVGLAYLALAILFLLLFYHYFQG